MTEYKTLTAIDVRAIRGATSFYVYIDGHDAELTLSKRITRKQTDPFTAAERDASYRVLCNIGSTNTGSAGDSYTPGELQALGAIVRPGDALIWSFRSNGNGYVEHAIIPAGAMDETYHRGGYSALYVDELILTIARRNKTVVRDLVMCRSITPDNTARMRRPINRLVSQAS